MLIKKDSGISLIELMISIAIFGVVSLGIVSLLNKPTKFVNDISDQLEKGAQSDVQGAAIVRYLSRTFPMRRGFFNCGTSTLTKLLSLQDPLPNAAVPDNFEVPASFTIAASTGSSLGAIDSDKNLVLPGQSRITKGTMILLSLMSHPELGGVYRVSDANPDTGLYALESAKDIPADFGCTIANSMSLDQLLSDKRSQMAGVRTQTYRADVIQVVNYLVKDDAKGGKKLVERLWPANDGVNDGAIIGETISYDDYLGLTFNGAKWEPQNGVNGIHGRFSAGLIVKQQLHIGSRSLASKQVARQIAYATSDGGNVNRGTVTAPLAADFKFPTCAIVTNPVRDLFRLDDDQYSDMYRVEGRVADAATVAKIEIRLTSSGTALPVCWQESDATRTADNRFGFSTAAGLSTMIAIGPTKAGPLSTVICNTPPGAQFSGTMVYFHAALNTIVRQPCSPASFPNDPVSFVYDGPATTCRYSGQITFGRLVQSSPSDETGPTLFTGDDGCQWSTVLGAFTDCQPLPSRGNLTRIRMRPFNIPGGIPLASVSTAAGATDKNELDCVP